MAAKKSDNAKPANALIAAMAMPRSSLNFFSQNPDNRFLDAAFALKALKENYFIVESDFELGDIIAFLDENGDIFHAAVYIAA
jgi:hypothetical protein